MFQLSTNVPYLKITQVGIYTVEVVNDGCTSARSANFSAVITGIKNHRNDIKYSIFPNPNNGTFEIRLSSTSNKTAQLKVYNISGQVLFSEDISLHVGENSKMINLSGIEKGMYLVNIITEDEAGIKNIVVQ